jgi:hypothetical protein
MIVICDFMLKNLRLRGDELLVYAIIYGFTQEEERRWMIDTNYISEKLGLTEATIDAITDSLCDKDLIGFDYDWNIQMKIIPIDAQRCHIILSGDDTENHTLYGLESVWYRTYSPSRIPIKNATINDTRVRLRVKPNLNSDTWGYLNTGDYVKIKDKTAKPMEIDGESWYWYRVDAENLPDGWVYGKYLDIEEYAEED